MPCFGGVCIVKSMGLSDVESVKSLYIQIEKSSIAWHRMCKFNNISNNYIFKKGDS